MSFEEIIRFIENHKAPYNNNQTAEWNQHMWKTALLWDLKKENEKCASSSVETQDSQ